MSDKPPQEPYAARFILVIGAGAMFFALVLVIVHAHAWLWNCVPVHYAMSDLLRDIGLGYPVVPSAGIQRMIDWVMASPAAAILLVTGLFFASVGGVYERRHDKRLRDSQRAE